MSSSNVPLICLVSLLAGETGNIHGNRYFTGTDSQISVIVLLTLWKGFRTCRMDFCHGFVVLKKLKIIVSLGESAFRSSGLVISFYRDGQCGCHSNLGVSMLT
jgi:hypothetical protein